MDPELQARAADAFRRAVAAGVSQERATQLARSIMEGAVSMPAPPTLAESPQFGQLVAADASRYQDAGGPGVGLVESVAQGVKDVGQGIKQLYLMAADPERAREYTAEVNEERAEFEERQGGPTFNPARLAGNALATVPAMLVPGGQATLIPRIAAGAAAGGLASGAMFSPEGTAGSKVAQTAAGAVAGPLVGEAIRGAGRALAPLLLRNPTPVVPGPQVTPTQAGRQIQTAITGARDRIRGQVGDLFDAARAMPGVDEAVGYGGLGAKMDEALSSFDVDVEVPAVVRRRLAQMAERGDDVTVGEVFELRALVNARDRMTNNRETQAALRSARRAIDDFLNEQTSGTEAIEAFRAANRASAQQQQTFAPSPMSNTIRERVSPDRFVQREVIGGNVDDLTALRDLLLDSEGGPEAWETARRQVVDYLNNRAVRETGFSTSAYETALQRIGADKLAVLFTEGERRALQGVAQQPIRSLIRAGTPLGIGRNVTNAYDVMRGVQGPASVDRIAAEQAQGALLDRLINPGGRNPLAALIGAGFGGQAGGGGR